MLIKLLIIFYGVNISFTNIIRLIQLPFVIRGMLL